MTRTTHHHGLRAAEWSIVGLGLRIAAICILPGSSVPEPFAYKELASNLLTGKGYTFFYLGPPNLKKLLYFFSFSPTSGLLYSAWKFHLYKLYYGICAVSALAGGYILVPREKPQPYVPSYS